MLTLVLVQMNVLRLRQLGRLPQFSSGRLSLFDSRLFIKLSCKRSSYKKSGSQTHAWNNELCISNPINQSKLFQQTEHHLSLSHLAIWLGTNQSSFRAHAYRTHAIRSSSRFSLPIPSHVLHALKRRKTFPALSSRWIILVFSSSCCSFFIVTPDITTAFCWVLLFYLYILSCSLSFSAFSDLF